MSLRKWSLIFSLTFCTLLMMGCESEDDSDSSTNGSVVPGVVDANGGFNVKINNPVNTDHYIHRSTSFDTACAVASNETNFANQDIICIVEVEELAGANTGVKMVLNAPPGMCKYVWHLPYYYYGRQHGTGPTAIVANFDADGNFVSAGSSITGPGTFSSTGEATCNYNYSAAEGPDCCYGSYTLRTVTPTSDTTTTQEWTGKPGNCAAGSGKISAQLSKEQNLPMGKYYFGGSGFNQEFDTGERSIIDSDSSLFYANYYSGTAPAAFMLASSYPANPYYTWVCLDDAEEVVARIRVQIREWNESSEFELGATGNPDTTGTEPNWGMSVNDFRDWLDIFTGGDGYPGMPEI